jgi:transcriptional regulator with XRE-family HTH domain
MARYKKEICVRSCYGFCLPLLLMYPPQTMEIGLRLKQLRDEKNFSQGDIEKRTSLLRCYVSRVENGYTVPNVETLEKWARALEMPLYKVMYDGDEPPKPRKLSYEQTDQSLWGSSKKEQQELRKLCRCLANMNANQRNTLLNLAAKLARQGAK